jgi:hypothetical protein
MRSGQTIVEFLRCNPHPRGLETGDTADGLAEVLSASYLDRLVGKGGVSIIYTHLGKTRGSGRALPEPSCQALRRLAQVQKDGKVLVATTRRILDYCSMSRAVEVRTRITEGMTEIQLITKNANQQASALLRRLAGLTVYVSDPARTVMRLNGVSVDVDVHPADETGAASVSIPWPTLTFPDWP